MRAPHLVPLPPSPVSPEVLTRAETLAGAFEELARRHPDPDVDHFDTLAMIAAYVCGRAS